MSRIRRLTLLLAGVLLSGPTSSTPADEPRIQMGKPFPELFFQTLEGEGLRSMAHYRGEKILLLNFASW